MDLKDKVALITGASSGIGKEVALDLAKAGCKVVINYIDLADHEQRAEKIVQQIRQDGGQAIKIQADVSKMDEVQKMFAEVLAIYTGIDILINNAGITRDTLLMRMKEQDWDSVIDVNLKSVFNCSKTALKPMMKRKEGVIINMSSVVGRAGNPGQTNYAASKAGILGFTKSLAREVASRNIRVNAVAPGYIATEMTEKLSEEVKEAVTKQVPLQAWGSPADVAGVIRFLVSKDAKYITGQTISVDGGLFMI